MCRREPNKNRMYLYGFGNTEEKLRLKIFGTKEWGRKADGPLDHASVHHLQQLAKAAVVFDARAIRRQVIFLKQRAFGCAAAAADAAADGAGGA